MFNGKTAITTAALVLLTTVSVLAQDPQGVPVTLTQVMDGTGIDLEYITAILLGVFGIAGFVFSAKLAKRWLFGASR